MSFLSHYISTITSGTPEISNIWRKSSDDELLYYGPSIKATWPLEKGRVPGNNSNHR